MRATPPPLPIVILSGAISLTAFAEQTTVLPEVHVEAPRIDGGDVHVVDPDGGERAAAADTAGLLEQAPGVSVVRNGQLTGIVQLRGLFNERVRVSVDGMHITPACPNHMDPPLHYTTPQSIDTIEILSGVTPVSAGGDSIAGTIRTTSPEPEFNDTQGTRAFGQLTLDYNAGADATGARAVVGAASTKLSVSYRGETRSGDDPRIPGGTVRASGFNLVRHDVTLAAATDSGLWRVDLGKHRNWDTGTPALPMDIAEDSADRAQLGFSGDLGAWAVEARAYRHDIDHLMDNFSLRPNPAPMMHTFAPSRSVDTGAALALSTARSDDRLGIGAEYFDNDYDAHAQRLLSGVRQDLFRDASRNRLGLYAEWNRQWSARWSTEAGLRHDIVRSDAAAVVDRGWAPASDQVAFNSRDHDRTDRNWDWTLRARHAPRPGTSLELAIARKTRSPSLLERYIWTPTNASAGQADGRTYVGNLDLEPEVSHQIQLGAMWQGTGWSVAPALFYNRVDDFIQGQPLSRLDMSGNPVLQYTNIDRAELHGLDGRFTFGLTRHLSLDGSLSYTRGRNPDTGDDLYRIAPLRGNLKLGYERSAWKHGLELVFAARQDDVSELNGETPTPGYAIVNLRTRYRVGPRLDVHAGVDNLFDREYTDHLQGVNRVADSDVPVGVRIPGAARFGYVSLDLRW